MWDSNSKCFGFKPKTFMRSMNLREDRFNHQGVREFLVLIRADFFKVYQFVVLISLIKVFLIAPLRNFNHYKYKTHP